MRAHYKYDVFGNRIEKAVDADGAGGGGTTTTRFAYDGIEIWADLDGSSNLQTRYIKGDAIDQIFARISSGGTAAWYLTDRQGSVRNVVDASGNLIATLTYDGFGNLTSSEDSDADRYRFTGREWDSETGLQYNRARYYVAAVGRWTTEDPIRFEAGDSNLYRYVFNNSHNATDPTGNAGFGFGFVFGSSVDAGFVAGVSTQTTGGVGLFWSTQHGMTAGAFGEGGGFIGGPDENAGYPNTDKAHRILRVREVFGAYAGVGAGGFFTNAETADDLKGAFLNINLNAGVVSGQLAFDENGTFIFSFTIGWGAGFSFSVYPTITPFTSTHKPKPLELPIKLPRPGGFIPGFKPPGLP
jgi:RHS repeat-associated protein